MNASDTSTWTYVITPKKRLLDIDFRELWRYRDLYVMYVKRDFITLYKQTIFGPLWYLIQPLVTTVMYVFVFGHLAGLSTDGVPQPLFYMCGVLLWGYFQSVFNSSSSIFAGNANLFGKVYFPRLIVPLSTATSNLIKSGIQVLLFIALYIYCAMQGTEAHVTWALLLLPLLILMTACVAVGWGLIITALTAKYRDLRFLVSFGVNLFMYATPVIYPLSIAPERYRWFIDINPLTPLFEALRYGCLGVGTFSCGSLLYGVAICLLSLFVGVIIFNRAERTFMDSI
jgi:lipopolysaccharide transport system permease protein